MEQLLDNTSIHDSSKFRYLVKNFDKFETQEFKRKVYYKLKNFVDNDSRKICIFLGPRKCGKTICLEQLYNEYNSFYISFERYNRDAYIDILKEISMLPKDEEILILLDEITYVSNIAGLFVDLQYAIRNTKIKVIITGNQAEIIKERALLHIATNATYIRTSFIDFEEWLVYKNKTSYGNEDLTVVKNEFLIDYFYDMRDFYNIHNNVEYIKSCFTESDNARQCLPDRYTCSINSSEVDINLLEYLIMSSLVSSKQDNELVGETKNIDSLLKVKEHMSTLVPEVSSINNVTLLKSIAYLIECNIIVVYHVNDNMSMDIAKEIKNAYNVTNTSFSTNDILSRMNICVKHPMFLINALNNISKEDLGYDNTIDEAILKCYIRGLILNYYDDKIHCEYRYGHAGEIDYVDYARMYAIEISMCDKEENILHFSKLENSKDFSKLLVSGSNVIKTCSTECGEVNVVPYGQYAYSLIKVINIDRYRRYVDYSLCCVRL